MPVTVAAAAGSGEAFARGLRGGVPTPLGHEAHSTRRGGASFSGAEVAWARPLQRSILRRVRDAQLPRMIPRRRVDLIPSAPQVSRYGRGRRWEVERWRERAVVGDTGFEPVTSAMSTQRSNQLS